MNRVIGATVVAAAVVLLAVACATPRGQSGTAGAASAGTSASASVPGTAAQTPKQRADTDAASILASFVPPPGAVRLATAPASAVGLTHAPIIAATTGIAETVSWWRVPGNPQTVLGWEAAHVPSRFTALGRSSFGSPPTMWAAQFALPAVTGVLSARNLGVEAVSGGGGKTILRVDAQVTWVPAKPASEHVPAAAKVVTVSVLPGMVVRSTLPAPVTITDPAKVHAIVAATDALPLRTNLHVMCPADFGESVRLTFTAKPGGPALAVAVASMSGCGLVTFSTDGKPQPPLSDGVMLARKALTVAGLSVTPIIHGAPRPGGVNPGGPMIP